MAHLGRRPTALRTSISYLANKVSASGHDGLTEFMASHGLARPHFTVLVALEEFGAMAQHELAERTGHNPGHLVGHLDELESHRCLTRSRDPKDRRRNIVELSDAGRELVTQARRAAVDGEKEAFAVLSATERKQLAALLTRIIESHEDTP